jgi:nanoRNase/pAp phosphatase (c-di-AMP/oligoRNAs hydrolase)
MARRSDRFLEKLKGASRVTLLSHVQPDPDSIGSMLGLAQLIGEKLDIECRLTRDGIISRAENRAMVECLQIDLVPIEEIELIEGEMVVMVDSQPNTGRHTLDDEIPVHAVIDHHETRGNLEDVEFSDIRPGLGATCTLVTSYLREQGVEPDRKVATALWYGIETELAGWPREAGPQDDAALEFLFPLSDKNLLARIRNARLPQSYFGCLVQALQSSFIYDNLIISWIHELPQPELAAEVVEYLIRFEEVDWAVCAGVHESKLVLSMRAAKANCQAGEVLKQVVGNLGRAGGHDRRAGGCVPLPGTGHAILESIQGELRRRLLKVLHIDEQRGQRLVSRRELLQNLQA